MSSEAKQAISYIFTWHSMGDACPKCLSLNAHGDYENQDIYQGTLWDPFWGDIWDLTIDHSLAHPHCRCTLEVRVIFDWEKLRETDQLFQILHQGEYVLPGEIKIGEIDLSSVTELKQQLTDVTQQVDVLEQKSAAAGLSLRQQVHVLNEMLMLIELASGDKNIDAAAQKTQEFIMVLLRLRMMLFAIQEAEAGILGPLGWLYAGANALAFGMSLRTLGQ